MHGLKSANLAIFQKGLGWPWPVSAALKNASSHLLSACYRKQITITTIYCIIRLFFNITWADPNENGLLGRFKRAKGEKISEGIFNLDPSSKNQNQKLGFGLGF